MCDSSSSHGPRGARLPRRARVLRDHPRRRGPVSVAQAARRACSTRRRARSRRSEDAPGCFDQHDARVGRRGARGCSWRTAPPLAPAAVALDCDSCPRCSSRSARRRRGETAPDANRMDYARSSRAPPNFPTRLSTRDVASARYPRRGARTPKAPSLVLFTRALEESRPSETCEPATNGATARVRRRSRGASRASPGAAASSPRRRGERGATTCACRDGDGDGPRARAEPPPDTRGGCPARGARLAAHARRLARRECAGGDRGAAAAPLAAAESARASAAHLEVGARYRGAATAAPRGPRTRMARGRSVCDSMDVAPVWPPGRCASCRRSVAVAACARARPRSRRRRARRRSACSPAPRRRWWPRSGPGRAGDGLLDRPGGRRGRAGASASSSAATAALGAGAVRPSVGVRAPVAAGGGRRARVAARARALASRARRRRLQTRASSRRWTGTTRTRRCRSLARGRHRVRRAQGTATDGGLRHYLYVYSWKILFIDDWRVVATDPPFAFVRCVRAHTGGAREGRARSRAAGEMHGGRSANPRAGDWFGSLPLRAEERFAAERLPARLCLLFGYDAFHEVCMAPHWVLHQLQVYRILTAPLFHGGIIHLAFNMTATVPMASSLERLLGACSFCTSCFSSSRCRRASTSRSRSSRARLASSPCTSAPSGSRGWCSA